ncbi:Bipolar DNA helicase HerA [Candidatus Syntrophocurvum alkaliphilum]|uniref:Bipolar DNA helicase HerA n=1 Tax=Candidatus Syntrophocurvum alkaliphilum TaxID=2293317 RepID=A0A6I6DDI2_9FIRM|nr:ATP-binding protein [Candidatus Syntrophocurvum alkaliphilum]QGT99265.1 Bipolar DNA helicase HerA [Candidatus Syntrophocurvum alkaliphilum]
MQVVGMTNEHEVWATSGDRKFRLNELLIIEDEYVGNPVGEVIETYALNPFIPTVDERSPVLIDSDVVKTLGNLGYHIQDEMIYIAKIRILSELFYPVKTGAVVREPLFEEVEDLLIKAFPNVGLTLGIIQGTEGLLSSLPSELSNIAPLFNDKKGVISQNGVPFILDYKSMQSYPHLGVFGGSGSGKSFGLRVIIEELISKKIPLLIFDPHYEMNFKDSFSDELPDKFKATFERNCTIVTVGSDVGVKFDSLGPGDLCNLLGAVSPITEAMENAVASLLENKDSRVLFIERLSNLISLLESPSEETFRQEFMQRKDIEEKKKSYYLNRLLALKKQVGQLSTLKSISWRLNRLVRQGIFMDEGIKKIEDGLKAQKAVIVRGNIWMLRVYAAYVLRSIYTKRREYRDAIQKGLNTATKFPPFIVVTDEAHNFAPRGEHNIPSRREIKEISQEGRKYGVFLILATQRPALLDDTVNAQLNTKIIFRTVRSTDLAVIREETDIGSEEIKRLPYLLSGTSFISSPIFGRTISVKVRVSKTKSPHQINPFDELTEKNEDEEKIYNIINEFIPISETNLLDPLLKLEEEDIVISEDQMINYLDKLVDQGQLVKENNQLLGFTYKSTGDN